MKLSKRNLGIICLSIICIIGVTFLAWPIKYIGISWIRIVAVIGLNLSNGLIAWVAMKLLGMKIALDLRNKRQFLIGAVVALGLSVVIAVIPALFGGSLVGGHLEFSWSIIVYELLFYMLVIGPVEEFVFRVYLQDVFVSLFEKHKWIGVVIAAFGFGLWHLINGSLVQVLFTFGIGLVFGFAKYKIKDLGYLGVAFGHGLYDFLNIIVRMFLVLPN